MTSTYSIHYNPWNCKVNFEDSVSYLDWWPPTIVTSHVLSNASWLKSIHSHRVAEDSVSIHLCSFALGCTPTTNLSRIYNKEKPFIFRIQQSATAYKLRFKQATFLQVVSQGLIFGKNLDLHSGEVLTTRLTNSPITVSTLSPLSVRNSFPEMCICNALRQQENRSLQKALQWSVFKKYLFYVCTYIYIDRLFGKLHELAANTRADTKDIIRWSYLPKFSVAKWLLFARTCFLHDWRCNSICRWARPHKEAPRWRQSWIQRMY